MVRRRVGGAFGVFAPPRTNPEEALPALADDERPDCVDIPIPTEVRKVPGAGRGLSGPPERGVSNPDSHQVRSHSPSGSLRGHLWSGDE